MSDAITSPPGTPPTDAAAGGKRRMLPILIAVYVLSVLAAAALVERVVVPGLAMRPAAAPQENAAGGHDTNNGDKHGSAAKSAGATSSVYLIEDLVVNPAGSDGMRYLAASIGLRSKMDGFLEAMKANEAPVKDALIRILSSKTVDDLGDVSQRESMREEILAEVQRLVPSEDIDAVYFMRFVLQ